MQILKLYNGTNVEVVGQVNIDNNIHLICKLPNAVYAHNTLIKYVLLSMHEFEQFDEKLDKDIVVNQ